MGDSSFPFAKVHYDKSLAGKYQEDSKNAIEEIDYLVRKAKDLKEKTDYKGYEVHTIGTPSKSGESIYGNGVIFFPDDEIIVTIYFFVPDPKGDNFGLANLLAFKDLQTDFMRKIIDSVGSKP